MFALLFVASVFMAPGVLAWSFMDVSVDGVSEGYAPVSVVLGENVEIEVEYSLDNDEEDVVVEAELAYGKGRKIEASTSPLDALADTTYKARLNLQISDKIEVTPPGEIYYLSVELKNDRGRILESTEFDLTVQKENDLLEIQKIMATPFAEAGKTTIVTVVVKNIGSDEQEDLYLLLNVPELGVALEKRIGDLDTDDDDVAEVKVPLSIPENAVEGNYVLKATAYNDDVKAEGTKTLFVSGDRKVADSTEFVSGEDLLEIKQGKSGTYELTLLNLGSKAKTFTVSVDGLEGWASYVVDPLSVKLNPGTSHVVELRLKVYENALEGKHSFKVSVESDGKVARELTLAANVKENTLGIDAMLISVIVLAIILIVLLLVLVKSKKAEEESSEESYY